MSHTTIAEIAARAGASTATADRVLTARAGVRPANRHRVLRAARILGYLPLEGAVALPSRPARLKYLIPYGANPFMHEVADTIRRFAREQPLVARCDIIVLEGIGPEPQEAGLERLSRDTDGVGVITTDHPRSREALGRLCAAGVRVAT